MKEIRIVAPSKSLDEKDNIKIKKAKEYFKEIGYEVTLGKYIFDKDEYFGCSSIQNRVTDLMNAFIDKNVEIVLCANGGYSVNQILSYLDYNIIKNNPKIIIGYSDVTALLVAIMSKTNLITYNGPMLTGFSTNNKYTLEYFEKALKRESFTIIASKEIMDYQKVNNIIENINFKNTGMVGIQNGSARGKIIGGNLCTLNLLQGTEYMPNLNDTILFIEDDADDFENDVFLLEFDRNLESLLQLPNCNIKGIVFGRFQLCSNMTMKKMEYIIKNKVKLKDIPIVTNVDFGHTNPMITIPIGGFCKLNIENNNIEIKIEVLK